MGVFDNPVHAIVAVEIHELQLVANLHDICERFVYEDGDTIGKTHVAEPLLGKCLREELSTARIGRQIPPPPSESRNKWR